MLFCFLYRYFSLAFFIKYISLVVSIATENECFVNYLTTNANGTLRLIPDDSTIMDNRPFELPDFTNVSHNCESLLPSQSLKLLQNGLSILHLNARSLHQSFQEIVSLVTKSSLTAHFVLISETWLDPNLQSGYQLPGYEMVHCISELSFTGKGCSIYIRRDIFPFCKEIDDMCAKEIEFQCIVIRVSYPGKPVFYVCATYRSPSYPLALFLPYLESTLNIINRQKKACFWGGDWGGK